MLQYTVDRLYVPDTVIIERFFSKTRREDSHLIWTDVPHHSGYGQFYFEGISERAHRVAWLLEYGYVPVDKDVLHECDIPLCVEKGHLYLGTPLDNRRDSIYRNRRPYNPQNARQTRLTWDDVRSIRSKYSAGFTRSELAVEYKIGHVTVWRIVNNIVWRE